VTAGCAGGGRLTETPELRGPRAVLRPPSPDDVAGWKALGVDPEIERLFGHAAEACSERSDEDARWLTSPVFRPDEIEWIVAADDAVIGSARLHSWHRDDRHARYAIGILSSAHFGRGLGTEATRLVLRYGFEVLGLHRVAVRVLAFNERAIRCYRSCGFREEGRERESCLLEGEWHDDVIMGLLENEYRTRAPSWPEPGGRSVEEG